MKIVETPPKTGEEFIVAWFDDGEPNSRHCKLHLEHDNWVWFYDSLGWVYISDRSMEELCKNSLIIIEG